MNVFAYEGAWQIDHIVIVGVGGTGSALARLMARMLWGRGQSGQSVPELHLIDPDMVEAKNLPRQAFSPSEIALPKARAIALRYSLAYGLPIEWAAEEFDPDKHLPRGSLLIDCTDNHLARREIVRGIEEIPSITVISCGNARTHGQVVLGSCGDRDKLAEMIARMEADDAPARIHDGLFRPCYHLPHFGLVYPELLEPEPPQPESELSCAELVALGDQHPLINELMATVCAGYVYKLLHREPITTFITQVDLHNFACTSTPITPTELRRIFV